MTGLWKAIMVAGAAAIFAVIVFFWVSNNQVKDGKKIDKHGLQTEQKYIDTFGTDPYFTPDKKKRHANAKKSVAIDKQLQDIDTELKGLDSTNKQVLSDTEKSLHEANKSVQRDVKNLDEQMIERLKGGK